MAGADDKPSFLLEIERVSSRPAYASFKTAGTGEIAFDNAKTTPDLVRVRLLRVEGSRQTAIMEHVPAATPRAAAAAAPSSRKAAKARAPQHHSVTTKRASMAITGMLILMVIFLVLEHLSN